jgi:hypothetical protein
MNYVLLIYADDEHWAALSARARDTLAAARLANDAALRQRGHLLAAQSLHSSSTATTVRVRSGKLAVGDGPVAVSREQLSAICTIYARDLNEAIQVAAQMPQARMGPIEIRPLVEFDQE